MRKDFCLLAYTVCIGIALVAGGCNDWLDVKPKSQAESEELFSREQGFKDALTACYIKMNSTSLYGMELMVSSIEYMAQFWDFTNNNDRNAKLFKDFDYSSSLVESTFKSIYSNFYNTNVQANSVLENLQLHGEVIENEKLRKMIEAEALGIRAFCHFDILRLFGQLPQNATIHVQLPYAKTVGVETIPYYTFDDYVGLVLDDINKAQNLFKECDPVLDYPFAELNAASGVGLEDSYMGYRRFRFNYWAMEALKARLYLYIGNKEKAYTAAHNVIDAKTNSGQIVIDLVRSKDFYSECILALSNNEIKDNIGGFSSSTSNFMTAANYGKLFSGKVTTDDFRAKDFWAETVSNGSYTYYEFVKYKQPEDNIVNNSEEWMIRYQVIPLIRLSEMYLIVMETAELTEANKLYKSYMAEKNALITTDMAREELNAEILNEYRREFWGEGQMFYAYKRLGVKEMMWKTDREVEEKDYIVPLPTTESGSN